MKKAVILLSGGIDSTTCLAIAKHRGYQSHALSFNYGQRHNAELDAAKRIAKREKCHQHQIIDISIGNFGGSALVDTNQNIPAYSAIRKDIPTTYVPARNTVFLSIALGYAETISATAIFCGICTIDYSNYPDCRPEYLSAFNKMAHLATAVGLKQQPIQVYAPLLYLTKAETITLGQTLGVDYTTTVSCYAATSDGLACGQCDSCGIRREAFKQAGINDPTRYVISNNDC